jgi:DNA-binding MarR family transcriptional regulator
MDDLAVRPEIRAWLAIDRAHHVLSRLLQQHMAHYGLTKPQYTVLRTLGEQQSASLSELAASMDVTLGNLTGIVDRLEAADLVRRQRDATDRRSLRLQITPAGRELYQQAVPSTRGCVRELFSALSPQEISELERLLEKLLAQLHLEEVPA